MLDFNNLWLVRSTPEKENCLNEFLNDNIIAIGWSNLPDLTGCDKDSIIAELSKHNYATTNVTIGVINHFVNNMEINDLCLIPNNDKIYIAKIVSSYYYDASKKIDGYPHQRKVEFLNKENPISRSNLPEDIQKSLRAQNTVANLNHRTNDFKNFLSTIETSNSDNFNLQEELVDLLPKAIEIIKTELDSNNECRKLKAAVEVLKLFQKYE